MGRNRKLSVTTPPLQTLLPHKIFCHDRNGPALGKLCHDIRGPLSQPKHPIPALNPVVTQNLCHDTGQKNLCRKRESLYRNPNRPACLGTLSRHGDPYRDTGPKGSVARACLSSAPRPGRALGLRTLSRHGRPCCDIRLEEPCHDINFSVATEDPKWSVAPSSPPIPPVFPFSFLSIHLNLNTQ